MVLELSCYKGEEWRWTCLVAHDKKANVVLVNIGLWVQGQGLHESYLVDFQNGLFFCPLGFL